MDGIVVGVEATPAGEKALLWALQEAVVRHVPLTAVRAWQDSDYGIYGMGNPVMPRQPDPELDAQIFAEEQLKLTVDQVPGAESLQTRPLAVRGRAADVLVNAGRDASLLVVGSRGLRPVSRAVLGSVSSSVLHHAEGPVAVIPEGADVQAGGRVLVGVDHSPQSLVALGYAVAFARTHGLTLVPVHAHAPIPQEGDWSVRQLELNDAASLLSEASAAGASDVPVEPEVIPGHAAQVLTSLSGPDDVLIVGSRGRGGFTGLLLGSTSTQCAQHARSPVIVIRPSWQA